MAKRPKKKKPAKAVGKAAAKSTARNWARRAQQKRAQQAATVASVLSYRPRTDTYSRPVQNATRVANTVKSAPVRDRDKPKSRLLDPARLTCKPRPRKTRGNGGSRPYVPWC